MTRLIVHVEGPTEETFVNEVLSEHLYQRGHADVSARIIGKARARGRRGGIVPWEIARQGVLNHLREDQGRYVSTMVDYYAMPNGWPGRADAPTELAASDRAEAIEDALLEDVCTAMGTSFNSNRFIPYVMMHEFEAMLFSDCQAFCSAIGRSDLGANFQAIRDGFASPEDIDDSYVNAPSKRIEKLLPNYDKDVGGTVGVLGIRLGTIRRECPHFADWQERLESLP